MNIFKKISLFSVIAFITIFLTGCVSKTALTVDVFSEIMEQKGYNVVDITKQYESYSVVKSATVALSSNQEYQIEFYVLTDVEEANDMYNENVRLFENSKLNVSTESTVSGKNYSKYTLTSNGKYMVASRIDNTFVYVKVADSYKDDIKDILDEIGY